MENAKARDTLSTSELFRIASQRPEKASLMCSAAFTRVPRLHTRLLFARGRVEISLLGEFPLKTQHCIQGSMDHTSLRWRGGCSEELSAKSKLVNVNTSVPFSRDLILDSVKCVLLLF